MMTDICENHSMKFRIWEISERAEILKRNFQTENNIIFKLEYAGVPNDDAIRAY